MGLRADNFQICLHMISLRCELLADMQPPITRPDSAGLEMHAHPGLRFADPGYVLADRVSNSSTAGMIIVMQHLKHLIDSGNRQSLNQQIHY